MKNRNKTSLLFSIIVSIFVFSFFMSILAEAQPIINEIMASNTSTYMDEDGDYADWIEIYNPGDTRIDLNGYGLSDRQDNPYKWIFPPVILKPKEYLIVYASGKDRASIANLHTNFKISTDGETLALTDPTGAICDSVYTKIDGTDISLGRKPDGIGDWALFLEPTSGDSNTTHGYQGYSDAVVEMSLDGGFYDAAVTLELSTNSKDGEIRYTIDGSEPSKTSLLYTSAVSIDTTTVIRSRVFEENLFPEPIKTQTFFINESKTLPVISLSTNPDNFFDEENGIYVNYEEDWERSVHLEFYESDGNLGFSIDSGVKISGFIIRGFPQKPLAIFARPKYGYNKINYQIFPDMPISEFKSITLRNGGDESAFTHTRFIDTLSHSLVNNSNIDIMAFRPAKVFINGVYWGIYNIREKQNEDYLASHHSIDPDNVDMLELAADLELKPYLYIIEGDSLHYIAMTEYIENHNMNDPVHYEYIKTQMDMDNFIDYNVAEMYLANNNWTNHNVKFWRPRTPNGRWRWIFCDLDAGINNAFFNSFDGLTREDNLYAPVFLKLLENESFKYTLINRFADSMNTIFTPDTVIQRINEIKDQLEPEMPDHIARWKDSVEVFGEKIESMEEWNSNIALIEEFAEKRPDSIRNHLIEYFNLSGTSTVKLAVSSSEAGAIKINSIIPEELPWSGIYFKDVPVQLTALPNLGYRFVGWTGAELADSISAAITLTDSISVTAVFEKIAANAMVIDSSQSPFRIAGIQSVASGSSLTVEAGVELLMSANASINISGEIQMNGTPENPIIISAEGGQNWNGIFLENAAGNSIISNVIISGASSWDNTEGFPAAVSSLDSDVTIDNVRFENNRQSIFANGGTVTVRNCFFADSNKNEPINIKNAVALVENCRFENIFFEDAIDYDGIHDGIIRDNEIFGTVDSDGDGIDIGDDCTNVLISGNLIYDCADKGISIGEGAKDIRVEKNIIAGCLYGIAVKDSATAVIDHNTLFDNDYAVAAYEKGGRRFGGGTAMVSNSILAKSNILNLFTDDISEITVSYTLSDSELLEGEGNIMADPMLASPDNRIFDLLPGSPAIAADNSGAELGALTYKESVSNIVINEINYNSSEDFNPGDWIELYNTDESPVDISGWTFKDEDDAHYFELPSNTIIDANAYLVLSGDETLFQSVFPEVNNCVGSFGFGLSAQGEVIRLYDANDGLVDWLKYNDSDPWPVQPDGGGPTLALIEPSKDNTLSESWGASTEHGTPGALNDMFSGIQENTDSETPIEFSLGQNYPNPFNPMTTIPFSVPESGRVTIAIYSILGQRVAKIIDDNLTAGHHQAVFRADHFASGIYFYRIEAAGFNQTKSMMLLK
ncbi:CotH kinase family protein [Candidatus Latescibacterota bacterium]